MITRTTGEYEGGRLPVVTLGDKRRALRYARKGETAFVSRSPESRKRVEPGV